MRVFLVFLLALGLASPAQAYLKAGPIDAGSGHRLQGVIAPLDGGGSFGTPAGAYSLRRLKSTYAGPAVKLRRASDNAVQDINFLGFTGFTGAPIDTAAVAAFCNATSCFYDTWYDQSGNGKHATQPTLVSQPAYIANCNGTKPCARTTGAQYINSATLTPPAARMTLGVVGQREAGTGICYLMTNNSLNVFEAQGSVANSWILSDNNSAFSLAAADAAWHAGIGVINAAASVLGVDGVETTGTLAGSVASGERYIGSQFSAASTTCDVSEALVWDDYALTTSERAALTANQRGYWGF